MKERILRVLMFFSFLSFGGLVIGVAIAKEGDLAQITLDTVMGGGIVILASALQYVMTAKWHPMALFKKTD